MNSMDSGSNGASSGLEINRGHLGHYGHKNDKFIGLCKLCAATGVGLHKMFSIHCELFSVEACDRRFDIVPFSKYSSEEREGLGTNIRGFGNLCLPLSLFIFFFF